MAHSCLNILSLVKIINIMVHSKSRDFFSVSKQFYILAEVESPPFVNAQILIFFINNIEGTLNQKVLFVITYLLN